MDKMWTFYLSVILLSVIQMQHVMATGCNILSMTSPSASSLNVKWSSVSGTTFLLNFKVVNSTNIAPVVVMQYAPSTERTVMGLKPGHVYDVTLNVIQFYSVVCTDTKQTGTVPATSQITVSKAISSTSVRIEWSSAIGADEYVLCVEQYSNPSNKYNRTFTTLSGEIDSLTPSTSYNVYIYTSNSYGWGAKSIVKTIITLVQPPTGVTLTQTGKSTAKVTWTAVNKVLIYQVSVIDKDVSNPPVIKNTSDTMMDISNLEPCSTYTVGVSSVSMFLQPGEPSEREYTTSPITPVTTTTVDYSCTSGTVTVTWDLVFGANSYRATALDGSGREVNCTSTSTSCQITTLNCGEKYQVRVIAVSDDCESTSNITKEFETVPCAPANAQATYGCGNTITYSWEPTNNTKYYVATAVDNTGKVTKCVTQERSCRFNNAGCGQQYTYSVYAVSHECNTEVSPPQIVKTSPCLPKNIKTAAQCQSDKLIMSWDSAAGALSYTVEALGNTGENYNCTTTNTSCEVSGVPCGQHLSVYIVATNNICTTHKVLGEVAYTVPCSPTNVSASVECSHNSARVSWTSGFGAIFYAVIAQDSEGNPHSCLSLGTSCLIENLNCGRNYTAYVIGDNLRCNSSRSLEVSFRTGPCPPTQIETFRDCDANYARIVWQNHQTTGHYTATIEDQRGAELNCTSNTVNYCKITSLPCGRRYNVTVAYSDGTCTTSTPHGAVTMNSVPCGPEDIKASLSCVTGEITVAWNISIPSDNYTTVINRGMGEPVNCSSTETQCSMGGLECGSSYTATVYSITGTCSSLPSTSVTFQTLPCPPTNVMATHTCAPGAVPVSWTASAGANSYSAVAVTQGHQSHCTTSTTLCSIPNLLCGQVYTIGVKGADDNCMGQQSNPVYLHTEPCVPSNVSSQLDCGAGSAQVSWDLSQNAVNYTMKATSSGHNLDCTSNSSTCTLSNLVCDQAYDIVVSATDGICASNYSVPFRQHPVPCAPENVIATPICSNNSALVSWEGSPSAVGYNVTVTTHDGHTHHYQTSTTSWHLHHTHCGQNYSITVTPYSHESCTGNTSAAYTFRSGPCPPSNVTVSPVCGDNTVSWSHVQGAEMYIATATADDNHTHTCSSKTSNSCTFTDLHCGETYAVTVVTVDRGCRSKPSSAVTLRTVPCAPENVSATMVCFNRSALVSWQGSPSAVGYNVTATAQDGHTHHCQSSTTSCEIPHIHCGENYSITVTPYSLESCFGNTSAAYTFRSGLCPPRNVTVSPVCGDNTVSWSHVQGAEMYIATATADDNHNHTCSSNTSNSCNFTDLHCGESYAVTVVTVDRGCSSKPSSAVTLRTGLCLPTNLTGQVNCGTGTLTLMWNQSPVPGANYTLQTERIGSTLPPSEYTTSTTSFTLANLMCGQRYTFRVAATDGNCQSSYTPPIEISTVPCAPENVSATLVCSNNSGLVSWEGSPSAVGYNVTVNTQDGHTHHYQTSTTSCEIPHIHCGENYSITVTPYSHESCFENPSAAYTFRSGPCPPRNVTVSPACEGNTVSWSNVPGAEMYIATATADDNHNHTCSSNTSNSCNFTELHCGESYAVTVVTVDRGCKSEPSSAVTLRTALCPPSNLTGQINYVTSTMNISWDQSPVPGAMYILQIEKIGSTLPPSEHNTSKTSYELADVLCGQSYVFRIAAKDGDCLSSYSPPLEISTAPCQPTNFNASVNCGTNKAHFFWAASSVPGLYTVEVTGSNSHVTSCSSNGTACSVKLLCGHSYSARLTVSTATYNSTTHTDIRFDSAPCLPENVSAVIDCTTNVMNVSWSETSGSDNYTAWAISTTGHKSSCNSTTNHCSIHDLLCGQVYEVAVTSSSAHCQTIDGSDYTIQSAPCKPENTTVEQNCSSNIMTVKWSRSSMSQNYTVEATSASGVNSTCDSTETSCTFRDLSCGQLYTFTVTGHTNTCRSEMSSPMEKHTAPCPPTSVSAILNCSTHKAVVSWSSAAAATAYSVQASTLNGHNTSCSGMGTSCTLNNLVCGQEYSVIVEAMNTGCLGPASAPAMLTTEPCVPMNLSVHYNVTTAQALWDAASGATSYSVRAVTDQAAPVTCNSTGTSCFLNGLRCSRIYNVTVTAHNLVCNSLMSETKQLMTEPCPPTNIQASMACEQLTVTVSWERSDLAVGYVAYINDQKGFSTSCVGTETDTSCVSSALMCGTEYAIWVKALGHPYNSSASTTASFTSGPCQPSSIEAEMDCEIDSATISWQLAIGAVSYVSELTASSGHVSGCTTNHTNCEVRSLLCGEEYNVTVTAVGTTCNSTGQMPGYLITEPCVPMNVSIHYNVTTAQVLWGAARGATSYSVQAVTDQGLTVTCNSTGTNCTLTGLQCSQTYNVTMAAQNQACNNSQTSNMHHLITVPCPPTNVQATMACEQLTATVSWEQSDLAVGYIAYLDNHEGHFTSCMSMSPDTSCVASDMMCGAVYNVWVKALGQWDNSTNSAVISLTSAPCLPTALEVEVDCHAEGAALVSWNATRGTANFSLTAIVSGSLQTLCVTEKNSCNVTGLSCGQTYNLSLTASNKQCNLTALTHANLTTRPCAPQRVAVDLQCGSHTAVLSWEERSGVELYKARAVKASGGEVRKCNSTGSSCSFPGLDCGETYNFTVTAHAQDCCSEASRTVFIQTEPCQPVIVSAQASCGSEEVQISWHQARGVVNYLITAKGNLGYVRNYNITQTLLSAALPCGQNYNVTVQGEGSECVSTPSSPAYFTTTPCVPRDVTTYVQCGNNMGSVSWGPSDGAESYVAVATGHDGHAHQCLTNTTSCTWEDLHCGEDYTVVVRAKEGNCSSLPSNSSVIHTDPCVPQNLVAFVNCDGKVVSLSWDASNGTQQYNVSAVGGNVVIELITNVTTASFSQLICGQNYTFRVTPVDPHCPSRASAPASIETWPCLPAGVSAVLDCRSSVATVTWQLSNGTDYYTATMEAGPGTSKTCMSQSNNCSVTGLDCGYNFSVSVTAYNQQCNVTSGSSTSLQSVPCIPTNVSVVTDCANNTPVVSWSASRGALRYSVTANSSHSNTGCETSGLFCSLDNLICGSLYTVHVVAMDDKCSSVPSQAVTFHSASCPPQNVSAEVDCASNDVMISWNTTREAEYFLASLTAQNGGSGGLCNTSDTSCSISSLSCGKTFALQVTSVRGNCSQHSQSHSIQTAPCQPQGIRGQLDCVKNSAWISWDAAPGADSYTVSADGGAGYTGNCTTSTNTTCEVEDLACGVPYNFSVVATNSRCDSPPSTSIELQTAPCLLSAITAIPQCHNSSILVVWDLMEGGEGNTMYMATAEASDHTSLTCNNTGNSCFLHGAQCDLHYTIIVSASSDQCSSMRSPPYRISMEPCPPRDVMVNTTCDHHSASVTWTNSPVAENYQVVAKGANGHEHLCNSTSHNCSFTDLHCDEQYSVFVIASHENCSSKASQNTTLYTGPCQPDGLAVTFHCENQSALLSWRLSNNAVEYFGCAQAKNGDMLYCNSGKPNCTIEGLDCGSLYNFSVQASDGTCNSSFSDPVQDGPAPCPPAAVQVELMPMEMEIQVIRFSWTEVACNDTEYLLSLKGSLLGDNQAMFDVSSYWTERAYFEIPLPCGSSYVATVKSRNAAGASDPSVALSNTTAPCPPSDAVVSVNGSLATVSWNASVFATTYTVYDNSVSPRSQLCSTGLLSCNIHQNITSSNLVITASNAAGESEARNVTNGERHDRRRRDLSEQTQEHGILPAPKLNVTQAMPTVFFLTWSHVEAASHYSLVIRPQGGVLEPQELTVFGESMILTDLSPSSTYCFSVWAWDEDTSGPESEPWCVRTGSGLPQ